MLDLVLTGGSVVTPAGPVDLAIGVKDGKIASLTDSAAPLPAAARTLKADGMVVVPGGIDPHVHCNMEHRQPRGAARGYHNSDRLRLARSSRDPPHHHRKAREGLAVHRLHRLFPPPCAPW
jgi:imidazolonepropionase-like amidohydrolase